MVFVQLTSGGGAVPSTPFWVVLSHRSPLLGGGGPPSLASIGWCCLVCSFFFVVLASSVPFLDGAAFPLSLWGGAEFPSSSFWGAVFLNITTEELWDLQPKSQIERRRAWLKTCKNQTEANDKVWVLNGKN